MTLYLLMFGATFLNVFLLGLQSKNVNQSRYVSAIVTSFGISLAQFAFVKFAASGSLLAFVVCAAGGCCGISFSIFFYKHVIERVRKETP